MASFFHRRARPQRKPFSNIRRHHFLLEVGRCLVDAPLTTVTYLGRVDAIKLPGRKEPEFITHVRPRTERLRANYAAQLY